MEQLGIYLTNDSPKILQLAQKTVNSILAGGAKPVFIENQLLDNVLNEIERKPKNKFFEDSDCIVVLGGDGTLLGVAREAVKYDTPLFGINAGKLGFLTEGDADRYEDLVGSLLRGDVTSDSRNLLECKIYYKDGRVESRLALNDVVIRNTQMRLMYIKVEAASSLLENFRADGLIVATPTGSTAYSLAASGPIVHPESNVLIVNPLCPQNLNDRPFIIPDSMPLKISFEESQKDIIVSMDGQMSLHLCGEDYLEISIAPSKVKLLRLLDSSYFERIRSKLYDIK